MPGRAAGARAIALVGPNGTGKTALMEALLFAAHAKLSNLMVIVDANGFQAMGPTDDVMALGNIKAKFAAFDFDVENVDGHDMQALETTMTALLAKDNGRPKAIVAKTVKGKGVSYMENVNARHYLRLNDDLRRQAIEEISGAAA